MNEYAKQVHLLIDEQQLDHTNQNFITNLIDDLANTNDSEQLLQIYGSPHNFIQQHYQESNQEVNLTPQENKTIIDKQTNDQTPKNKGLTKLIKVLYYLLIRIPFIVIRILLTIFILWATFTIITSPITSFATIVSGIIIILTTLSFFISLNAVITKIYRLIIKYIQFYSFNLSSLYSPLIWLALTIISYLIFFNALHAFIASISINTLVDRFHNITSIITNFIN